jgi:hypothetical protein
VARRRTRNGSSSTAGAFLVVLLVIGLVIKFIWWIIGAAVLVTAFYIARAIWRGQRARQDALARSRAELVARADQQHEWVMQGDDRGIYGPECAPLMHFIESGKHPTQAA